MKGKKGLMIGIVAALVVYIVAGWNAPALAKSGGKAIELSFSTFIPPHHGLVKVCTKPFAEELEKRTEGRVKIGKFYWVGALGTARDQYFLGRDGAVDMIHTCTAYNPGLFPMYEVGSLPLAANKNPTNVTRAVNALRKKGYFDKEFADIVPIFSFGIGNMKFLFRDAKPLKFEDLRGLKGRTPGGIWSKTNKALGFVNVPVAGAEWYPAFEKGIVDLVIHGGTTIVSYKLHEIAKSYLEVSLQTSISNTFEMSKKSFARLSPKDQQIMLELGDEMSISVSDGLEQLNNKRAKIVKEAGVEFYTWPEEEIEKIRQAVTPVWTNFAADLESKGLPGKQLLADFVSILRELGESPPYTP